MQLDQKALIEEAVQASIDAGLAVNGEHGVAAARHAARFMFNALQAVQPVPVGTEALTLARDYIIGLGQSPDAEGWPRDQYAVMATIEAALTAAVSAKPVAYTSQAQLDRLAEGKGGIIWSEPLPYHDDIELYAAAISGADNAK